MGTRRPGRHLLALLLLLQWGAAFGHCLQAHPAALTVEICGPDGVRFLALPEQDGEAPTAQAAGLGCPACHALPSIELPPPLLAPQRIVWTMPAAWQPDAGTALRPRARAPPPPARAPPHLV